MELEVTDKDAFWLPHKLWFFKFEFVGEDPGTSSPKEWGFSTDFESIFGLRVIGLGLLDFVVGPLAKSTSAQVWTI